MENPLDIQVDAPESSTLLALPARAPQEALGHHLKSRREAMEMSIEAISRTTKIPKASLLHLETGSFGKLPGDVFVRGFLRSYARCLKLDGDDIVDRYAQCGLNPAPVSSALAESLLSQNKANANGGRTRNFPRGTGAPPVAGDAKTEATANATSQASQDGVVQSERGKSESVRNVLRDAFDLRQWHRGGSKDSATKTSTSKNSTSKKRSSKNLACKESKPELLDGDVETAKPERQRTFIPPRLNFNDEMSHRGPLTLGVIILVIVATLTMSYLLRRPGTSVDGFTLLPQPELTDPGHDTPRLVADTTVAS